jgi:hypothetical protein
MSFANNMWITACLFPAREVRNVLCSTGQVGSPCGSLCIEQVHMIPMFESLNRNTYNTDAFSTDSKLNHINATYDTHVSFFHNQRGRVSLSATNTAIYILS